MVTWSMHVWRKSTSLFHTMPGDVDKLLWCVQQPCFLILSAHALDDIISPQVCYFCYMYYIIAIIWAWKYFHVIVPIMDAFLGPHYT